MTWHGMAWLPVLGEEDDDDVSDRYNRRRKRDDFLRVEYRATWTWGCSCVFESLWYTLFHWLSIRANRPVGC